MPTIIKDIQKEISSAIKKAFADAGDIQPAVTPATNVKYGDYQCNVAMGLAKKIGIRNPQEVAKKIIAELKSELLDAPEIAGPGFINLKLKSAWVEKKILGVFSDERLGVAAVAKPKTYVIDFSAPNIAKRMHVGHIRSTIIGDSLAKLFKFLGHQVITDNHLGDWGTQFGMLIIGYRQHADKKALEESPIEELERVYRVVNALGKTDDSIRETARQELVKLQKGDAENLALWKMFRDLSLRELNKLYKRLDVNFDYVLSESFYNSMLTDVASDIKKLGIGRIDDGALCVFFDEPHMPKAPFIVQKRDGAFNYATTDLATVKYRVEHFKADAILYVISSQQTDHLKQLFATAKKWGFDKVEMHHVEFGSVLGEDGKLLRTRSGDSLKLEELLDEAEERAFTLTKTLRPDFSEEESKNIANILGIGSVKYADLMQNRTTDYKFSMEKMISLEGNTAPYLIYSYVRARGILKELNAQESGSLSNISRCKLDHPMELSLAKKILQFPECLETAAQDFRLNLLATYLFELVDSFSGFYRDCSVMRSEGDTKSARLLLCDVYARTMRKGLEILGIKTVERM